MSEPRLLCWPVFTNISRVGPGVLLFSLPGMLSSPFFKFFAHSFLTTFPKISPFSSGPWPWFIIIHFPLIYFTVEWVPQRQGLELFCFPRCLQTCWPCHRCPKTYWVNDLGSEEEGGGWSIFDSTSHSLCKGWTACDLTNSPLLQEGVHLGHSQGGEQVEWELC